MEPHVDLLNTPGIYYAVPYLISCLIYLTSVPKKLSGWRKWGVEISVGAILIIFMVVTKNVPQLFFIPSILVDFSLLFSLFYLISDLDFRGCVYFTVQGFIFGEFVASMEWQLMYFGIMNWGMKLNIATNAIFIIPTYALLFGALYVICRRNKEGNLEFEFTRSHVLGAVLIGVVIYALSNLSFLAINTPFSVSQTEGILLLRAMIDFSGAVILILYDVVIRQMQATIEAKTLQAMLDTQYENYRTSKNSVDLINQKYHDLKHQIAILRNEVDSAETLKYLDKMEKEIQQYEAENKTGNRILDIILTSKSLICQKHYIEFTVVADGEAIDFMEPMDISSLFGNAIDNAIESVRKLDNYAERLIHLTVVRQKSFVRISIENRYTGEIKFRNGMPVTTKTKGQGYHGFGVKSMKHTVEKYGGSLTVSAEDGWFKVNILIAEKSKTTE